MHKVKKSSQTLDLRDILARRENSGCLVIPKPTGAKRHITLCEYTSVEISYRSLMLQCPLMAYTCKETVESSISLIQCRHSLLKDIRQEFIRVVISSQVVGRQDKVNKKSATSSYREKTLNSKYKSGTESNTEYTLSEQQSSPPTLPSPSLLSLLLPLPIPPPPYTMSQCGSINFEHLAQQ